MRYLFALLLLPVVCFADSSWRAVAAMQETLPCRQRLLALKEAPLLLTVGKYHSLIYPKKKNLPASDGSTWSSDLLLEIVSELEQSYGLNCELSDELSEVVLQMKKDYLGRLGLKSEEMGDVELLYRGLSVEAKAVPDLQKKIADAKVRPKTASEWLSIVYAQPITFDGDIVLIGISDGWKELPKGLRDGNLIYRVIFTARDGVGAYIPELSVLLLSRQLFDRKTKLHRLVIFHELAHVAIRSLENWEDSYASLSGWSHRSGRWIIDEKAVTQKFENRGDELSVESNGSPFSILPDPIVTVKGKEGFVLGRSYREVRKRNDLSEDLADHLAMAMVYPQRYCWKKAPVALKKWDWIESKFVLDVKKPVCN